MPKVIIECVEGNPGCIHNHKPGDRIVVDGTRMEGDICISAFNSMYPLIYALKLGVKLDDDVDEVGKINACCFDLDNLVKFKIWAEE